MIAFTFPGQGSQAVGMGRSLAEQFAICRDAFAEADAALGMPLTSLMFEGPAEQLTLTEYAQPAIVAVSVAAARVLASHGFRPGIVAGHSLGEYSAHVIAETLTFADALRLVRLRGRFMQEAVPVGEGAMAAVLGLAPALVEQACREAAQGDVVSPANFNAPGQVVIAGATAAVERACERAKALGARRAVSLQVSAPFHCALMQPAQDRLEPELRALRARHPAVPVVANVDARPKRTAADAIDALVTQVSMPVQWERVHAELASAGVAAYVEVGPGTVLTGLSRKMRRDVPAQAFSVPEDLAAVQQLIAQLQPTG